DTAVAADDDIEGRAVSERAVISDVYALDRMRPPIDDERMIEEVRIAVWHQAIRIRSERDEAAVRADRRRQRSARRKSVDAAADELGRVCAAVVNEDVRRARHVSEDEVRGLRREGHEAAAGADVGRAEQRQPPA